MYQDQARAAGHPQVSGHLIHVAIGTESTWLPKNSGAIHLLRANNRLTVVYPAHTAGSRTSGWKTLYFPHDGTALFQILENTLESHVDHSSLKLALERAEELCSQVNEGVREKENSDRLEWIQAHVQCEGLAEVRPVVLSWVPLGRLWVGNPVQAFP